MTSSFRTTSNPMWPQISADDLYQPAEADLRQLDLCKLDQDQSRVRPCDGGHGHASAGRLMLAHVIRFMFWLLLQWRLTRRYLAGFVLGDGACRCSDHGVDIYPDHVIGFFSALEILQ